MVDYSGWWEAANPAWLSYAAMIEVCFLVFMV